MKEILRIALACTIAVAVGAVGTAAASKLITGGQIRNGSIGLADLSKSTKRALQGAQGAPGAQGPSGPSGPSGPAGPQAISTVVRSQQFYAPPFDFAEGEVRCPDGMVALGGSLSPGGLSEAYDWPSADGRGWAGSALETGGFTTFSMLLSVICAPGSAQVLSSNQAEDHEAALQRQTRDSAR
jgi:hypothetical protein